MLSNSLTKTAHPRLPKGKSYVCGGVKGDDWMEIRIGTSI